MLTREELILLIGLVTSVTCKVYHYGLDNENLCQSQGVVAQWLENDDVIKLYGKKFAEHKFTECAIKLGPSSRATKIVTKIKFETYYNNDCGIYLSVDESPHAFFEKDVSTLFNFSCNGVPGSQEFYTLPGNNIRIILHKDATHMWNYNFIFNVSLSDHSVPSGISMTAIIGIGILIAIAIPGVGCIVFRYLKIRNWSKRQLRQYSPSDDDGDSSSRSHLPVSREQSRMPVPPRYSGMPGEETGENTRTCAVASRGSDGRCTVCHRRHDDFAHFVEMDGESRIVGSSDMGSNCQLCHRSPENFAHFGEIDGVTHVTNSLTTAETQRCNHRQSTGQSDGHGTSVGDEALVSRPGEDTTSSDEDLDLSGNDLIPPSYDNDLSPPPYEEAVTMPQPQQLGRHTAEETDNPLYQNIHSLTSES